jgi:uncharacterized protein (DUF1778 family)
MISANKKTERITARVSVDMRNILKEAAAYSGATLNQFLIQAAIEKAHAIIEQESVIRLSKRDAEVFFNAIENPPKANEKLKKAIQRYKKAELYE